MRNGIINYFYITLIFPFYGLYLSLIQKNEKIKKWSIIIFITIYGTVITFPENADATRFLEHVFIHYSDLKFYQWLNELKHIVIFQPLPGTKGDVYIHVISYLVGAVLQIPQLFFVFVSFIFAFFYVSGIEKVLKLIQFSIKDLIGILFIILLITYRGIDNLQTVRTWTGCWVLFNGVIGYYSTKRIKYLLLISMAPLFHIAYFLIIIPVISGLVVKRIPSIFIIALYVLSFFVSANQGFIIGGLKETELGKTKVDTYYVEEGDLNYSDEEESKGNFYVKFGRTKALHWGSNAFAISLIVLGLYSKKRLTSIEYQILTTGLLIIILANFFGFITAIYNRTMINAGLYIIVASLLIYNPLQTVNLSERYRFYLRFLFLMSFSIFIFHWIYTLSNYLYFTSVFILAIPFVVWMYPEANHSIREVLDMFL